MYTTNEEARNRLLGTVVVHNGEPVHVAEVNGRTKLSLRLWAWPFGGQDEREVPLGDSGFENFNPAPRLGFANIFCDRGQHASLVTRTPNRRMQQGLIDGNTQICDLEDYRREFSTARCSDGFREMIVGEYPTFDEAVEILSPSSSIAISREFALRMNKMGLIALMNRRDALGIFVGGEFYLHRDREYAREMIEENPLLPNTVRNL